MGMRKSPRMAENVIDLAEQRHARTSSETGGRGTSDGHSPSGHLSENHCKARSRRPTLMSEPDSNALSFLPSLRARELTVESGTPSISPYRRATLRSASMPDMDRISVSLPVLSTVKLPGADPVNSGHSTGMDHDILLENIERLLKIQKVSADAVSKAAKRPDAIRNLRRRVAGETSGSWNLDTLADIARALKTTPWDLLRPSSAILEDENLRKMVRGLVDEELSARENEALPIRKRKIR